MSLEGDTVNAPVYINIPNLFTLTFFAKTLIYCLYVQREGDQLYEWSCKNALNIYPPAGRTRKDTRQSKTTWGYQYILLPYTHGTHKMVTVTTQNYTMQKCREAQTCVRKMYTETRLQHHLPTEGWVLPLKDITTKEEENIITTAVSSLLHWLKPSKQYSD